MDSQSVVGGGNAPLIVDLISVEAATPEECLYGGMKYTFSHSWQEIYDAMMSGRLAYMRNVESEDYFEMHLISTVIRGVDAWTWVEGDRRFDFSSPTDKVFLNCFQYNPPTN